MLPLTLQSIQACLSEQVAKNMFAMKSDGRTMGSGWNGAGALGDGTDSCDMWGRCDSGANRVSATAILALSGGPRMCWYAVNAGPLGVCSGFVLHRIVSVSWCTTNFTFNEEADVTVFPSTQV